ncbi:cytochrome c biogenesis protein CcmE [Lamprobacter modestohalophilus]|jgi:cytochrome c-type biogenesis protein CcmE|uniref:Cytochrome c-type biogenesis protein CcmE n=1 Tax=Lamprobacter modestohalophilus TaxID=1064514 RepID=A0A9X1B5N2_9GAMM|nr:cytochrome c maturation protein CcmE [Lamprobacter modestohalophilus]MCF7978697.1 cytochrome c maturation protein CcmE [Chromatiaceae bacterium]MBK1619817.1 cytochrome c biogenesis protein CcmE [Lamprobacter modestohalophilus]MCF7993985.1 cytochrome c maturation protein CcmE [Chromatiaceae bacterium]MCF8004641.1 cytochrome c maturation protein CcmE [Chromatiaceae bacterium]MCF8014728.1 cytochrome c maturation protein CcmE [Chromatiaceae bacterium]
MKARQKRLVLVGLALVGVAGATTLALSALQSNISYFFSPSQVMASEHPTDAVFRVGGLVVKDTLARQEDGLTVHFKVTDNAAVVPVSYTGILPDLFSEGQGVVAKGRIGTDGVFYAEEVLAKHDESYMPPEVADTLQTAHVDGIVEQTTGTNTPRSMTQ